MYGKAVLDYSSPEALSKSCDGYLASRTGRYEWRCHRYDAAYDEVEEHGLYRTSDITVCDVGAGWTELGRRFFERGFRGRYWPIDGGLDGADLNYWSPPRPVNWFVCLELVEHLRDPIRLIRAMQMAATDGVVISTPNPRTTDVLGMDATHVTPVSAEDLRFLAFSVSERSFYGQPDDSLFAVWRRR
jgi:hypothetical protein